jgi:uncharacterized membrane protein
MLPLSTDLPIHPAIVHLPLGLALIVPALAFALLWARRGVAPGAAWAVVLIQALVFAGALAAEQTGERDEDRAEAAGAPEAAIEAHEEAAEVFVVLSGLTLGALALGVALRQRTAGAPALGLAALLALGALGQGLRVGHAGGAIVYGPRAGAQTAAWPAGGGEGGDEGGGEGGAAEGDDDDD